MHERTLWFMFECAFMNVLALGGDARCDAKPRVQKTAEKLFATHKNTVRYCDDNSFEKFAVI